MAGQASALYGTHGLPAIFGATHAGGRAAGGSLRPSSRPSSEKRDVPPRMTRTTWGASRKVVQRARVSAAEHGVEISKGTENQQGRQDRHRLGRRRGHDLPGIKQDQLQSLAVEHRDRPWGLAVVVHQAQPMPSFPSVKPKADCMAQRYTNGTATIHTTSSVLAASASVSGAGAPPAIDAATNTTKKVMVKSMSQAPDAAQYERHVADEQNRSGRRPARRLVDGRLVDGQLGVRALGIRLPGARRIAGVRRSASLHVHSLGRRRTPPDAEQRLMPRSIAPRPPVG